MVIVLLGLVGWFVVTTVGDAYERVPTCEVTEGGVALRDATDVGVEHRPDAKVGDTYSSDSGCLPPDIQR